MKKSNSWFKSEAKWAAALLYAPPILGLLGALALLLLKLLRSVG